LSAPTILLTMKYKLDISFLENYARQYAKVVCDGLFAVYDAVTGEKLVSVSPVSQVNQLLIEHIFSSWQLEAQRIQSPIFNYQATEVQTAFREFMNLLVRHIRMERSYFEPILTRAVYDTILFLLAPEQFLRKFVGEKSWEKEIKPALRYLKFHPELIEKWKLEVKTVQLQRPSISSKEVFEIAQMLISRQPHLLTTQPQLIIEEFAITLPVSLNVLLKNTSSEDVSTTEFDIDRFERELGFVEPTQTTQTNIPSVSEEAKEIITKVQAEVKRELLKEKVNQDNKIDATPPTKQEAIHIVENVKPRTQEEIYQEYLQNLKKQTGIEKATPQPQDNPKPSSTTKITTPPIETPAPQATTYTDIQSSSQATNQQVTQPAQIPATPTTPSKPTTLAEKLAMQAKESQPKANIASKLATDNQKHTLIKNTLNIHDRVKFQNALFGADFNAVNQAIEAIDRCQDYHTAVALVKENYATRYNWDMSNPVTIEFFKLLDKRF